MTDRGRMGQAIAFALIWIIAAPCAPLLRSEVPLPGTVGSGDLQSPAIRSPGVVLPSDLERPGHRDYPAVPPALATGALEVTFSFVADGNCNGGLAPVPFRSVVSGGTPPYNYTWNFGDGGAPSYDSNPTHVFSNSFDGPYNATVDVRDSSGGEAMATHPVEFSFPPCASRTADEGPLSPAFVLLALPVAVSLAVLVALLVGRARRTR